MSFTIGVGFTVRGSHRGLAHLYVFCKGGDDEVRLHSLSLPQRVGLVRVEPSPALLWHEGTGDFCLCSGLASLCYVATAFVPPDVWFRETVNLRCSIEDTYGNEISSGEFPRVTETGGDVGASHIRTWDIGTWDIGTWER